QIDLALIALRDDANRFPSICTARCTGVCRPRRLNLLQCREEPPGVRCDVCFHLSRWRIQLFNLGASAAQQRVPIANLIVKGNHSPLVAGYAGESIDDRGSARCLLTVAHYFNRARINSSVVAVDEQVSLQTIWETEN